MNERDCDEPCRIGTSPLPPPCITTARRLCSRRLSCPVVRSLCDLKATPLSSSTNTRSHHRPTPPRRRAAARELFLHAAPPPPLPFPHPHSSPYCQSQSTSY
jgi:hypothetical protein